MGDVNAAVYYGILAWLLCWMVDLIVIVTRGNSIEALIKVIIVIVCLALILRSGSSHHWYW